MTLLSLILGFFWFLCVMSAVQLFLIGLREEEESKNPSTLDSRIPVLKEIAIKYYKATFWWMIFAMLLSNLSIWLFYR